MDTKNVKTEDLIKELETRTGVKKIAVGPYMDYSLKRKYIECTEPVECDCVLLIDVSVDTPDNSSKQS